METNHDSTHCPRCRVSVESISNHFSPIASFKRKDFFIENLASIGQSFLLEQDVGDLISVVSILHEAAHYEQDFGTGVGHHEYYWKAQERSQVIAVAASHSQNIGVCKPLPPTEVPSLKLSSMLLMEASEKKIDAIRQFLEREIPQLADKPELFCTDRMLELDAICRAYRTLVSVAITESTSSALDKIAYLWRPFDMPPYYAGIFNIAFPNVWRSLYGQNRVESVDQILTALLVIRVICAISFSYPTSKIMNQEYAKRDSDVFTDYLPGVRFLNFLRAWGKLTLNTNHIDNFSGRLKKNIEQRCQADM